MIVSPRAKEIIDIVRKAANGNVPGGGFIKIDEVFLYYRTGEGADAQWQKKYYWKRAKKDPPNQLTSFAIVPEMLSAIHKGFGIVGNTLNNTGAVNAWKAFDRQAQTSGAFGTYNANANGDSRYAWAMVSFPEPRIVRGWTLQFEYCHSNFWLAIEGRLFDGSWTRLFELASTTPVNNGRYGAVTTPMQCTAVRLLTDYSSYPVRSCQFFDSVPLVPVTLNSNTGSGVELIAESNNYNLYRCFTEQSNAYTHGTSAWFYNGGEWRSNRGQVSTQDQNRFTIKFTEPKQVGGFSVGGMTSDYYDDYYHNERCYANCLLIEGRETDTDFWRPLGEVEFAPAERRSRYFDFAISRTVSQLRVTVQDITHGTGASNSASVYLPPMQVWGMPVERIVLPPSSSFTTPVPTAAPTVPVNGGNVMIIEQDGELIAVPIIEP